MKAISWIEFLITFFIFIIIFYLLFDNLRILISNTKLQASYVDYLQKGVLSSYYYIQTKEIDQISFILSKLNHFLISQEYLEFIELSPSSNRCFNCISIYYELLDKSINIVQNASLAHRSRLNVKIITDKKFYNLTNNAEIKCSTYLDLKDELILLCSIYLYGNSSVKIFPAKNYVYFSLIDSYLSIYDGLNFYKGFRQQTFPYYVRKAFEFYTNKENAIMRNVFIIN